MSDNDPRFYDGILAVIGSVDSLGALILCTQLCKKQIHRFMFFEDGPEDVSQALHAAMHRIREKHESDEEEALAWVTAMDKSFSSLKPDEDPSQESLPAQEG